MTTTLGDTGLSASHREFIRRLHLFLFGPYKVGKSIAAHQMPNTRTLDFDNGMLSIEWAVRAGIIPKELHEMPFETILPSGARDKDLLDRALAKINEWITEEDIPEDEWEAYCIEDLGLKRPYPQRWDTLIVDSMTGFNEGAINQSMFEMGGYKLSKSWDQWGTGTGALKVRPSKIQDYGGAANLTEQFITELRKLPKNIVVVAHDYTDTDDDGKIIAVQPLLWGAARTRVPAMFDEVWYMQTRGNYKNPEFVAQTSPDSVRRCGSRLGCLDPSLVLDFPAIRKTIAEFYEVAEEDLWNTAHGTAEVAAEEAKALERLEKGGRI